MVSSTSKPSSQLLLRLAGGGCNLSTARCAASAVFVFCFLVFPVRAQQQAPLTPQHVSTMDIAQFFAGAALGLGLHESGHLVLDVAFSASPGVRKVSAGFIPFFAITHEPVSPAREFAISYAVFCLKKKNTHEELHVVHLL